MRSLVSKTVILAIMTLSIPLSCKKPSGVSTPEDRAALFDYVLMKTMEREAFSPIKNQKMNLDVKANMLHFKDEMIAADTDQELFNVLMKISNARKDRHLSVSFVKGGLRFNRPEDRHAPIRFAADYGTPGAYFFFVSDMAKNIGDYVGEKIPQVSDRLLAVNRQPVDDYFKAVEPYIRYSSVNGLWWKFAEGLPTQTYRIPPTTSNKSMICLLERKDGEQYQISLPYLDDDAIGWKGYFKSHGEDRYPGFSLAFSTQTYDLYKNDEGKKVLLLDWYGFRENLVDDMDRLVAYASENNLLDHALIWDGTRSRGGSRGAYAIQRLSPKPFKTTLGNVRISDITEAFIQDKREDYAERKIEDSGVKETIEDGTWLMDWLENDVMQAFKEGNAYSNNVPFKLAHLPKDSDGILKPAEIHFRGPLICLLGPHGGSHLDQFAAMVVDNKLAYTVGMSTGGYSNTWEWEEILVFPLSKKPVVRYMWSIGHTIRPNGEILEGNPAKVDECIPVTRENYLSYYPMLLSRAMERLGLE